MTNPLKIEPALWELIEHAIHESVDNLTTPTDDGKAEIAESTLKAIPLFLRYHPKESVRRAYIQSVQELLAGKKVSWTAEQLATVRVLQVFKDPLPADKVLDKVIDILVEYGAKVQESEKKNKKKNAKKK